MTLCSCYNNYDIFDVQDLTTNNNSFNCKLNAIINNNF